jgi:predicted DNA-binding protein (UPF0251 family)
VLKLRAAHDRCNGLGRGFPSLPATHPTPESLLIERSGVEAVQYAIEQLPVIFREVILLCDVEGASYREIAEMLSIPIGTVMSRLARARRQFARRSVAKKSSMKQRSDTGARTTQQPAERGEACGNRYLAATLNTPISQLRPAQMERIFGHRGRWCFAEDSAPAYLPCTTSN